VRTDAPIVGVRVRVLGPVTIEGAATLAARDRRVLGALVVEAGRLCPADRLAEALYGSTPPPTWRKVIQGSIGRLRGVLGAHAISTVAGEYRLELGDDEIDVRRLERLVVESADLTASGEHERAALTLRAALELRRGEAFVDLDGWEPGRAAAARYDELVREAEERLVHAQLCAGDHTSALAEASELVVREPLREQRWAALALAQYRLGRQGDALRSIARARRVLVDELGLGPGHDLVQLEQAILSQDASLIGPVPSEAWRTARCPYRGLSAYGVDDADWYFGRDRDIADGLATATRTGFLAIVGASGSGKSSLARAGIAPFLRREGRDIAVVTPGRSPDEVLRGLSPASVLIVDQLEELFVLCGDPETRYRFAARLDQWSAVAPVIVTLRADYLGAVAELGELAGRVQSSMLLLGGMSEADLRDAIVKPAEKAGLRLEPGLVDLLVRDIQGQPGALPLLSHALAETYERREGPVLTAAGYRAAGGVQGAVARAADGVVDGLPPAGRRAARDLFLRLVLGSDTSGPIRQRVPRDALAADPTSEAVLDALVRTRLVIADQDTVEVAHEAICRAWPRLQAWLDEDREGVRLHRHLSQAAQEWERSGREPAELYRGPRLVAALDWTARDDVDLNGTERAFLAASATRRGAEEEEARARLHRQQVTNRRLRAALAAAAVLVVVALLAGLVAFVQRGRATTQARRADAQARLAGQETARARLRTREADAGRLAAQSSVVRIGQVPLAQLLAVEAHRLDASPATLSGLMTAADGIAALRGFITSPAPVFGLAVDPAGRRAVATTNRPESSLVVFDINRSAALRDLIEPSRVNDLEAIRAAPAFPFRLTLVANRDPSSPEVAAYTREPGSRETTKTDLPLRWPRGVLSLGHVALPFPDDDPVYGLEPDVYGPAQYPLGALTVRGEAGSLVVSLADLARLRTNPFFAVIRDRIVAAIEADRSR
jgi:DNA-binding SARP family transcriptional activator